MEVALIFLPDWAAYPHHHLSSLLFILSAHLYSLPAPLILISSSSFHLSALLNPLLLWIEGLGDHHSLLCASSSHIWVIQIRLSYRPRPTCQATSSYNNLSNVFSAEHVGGGGGFKPWQIKELSLLCEDCLIESFLVCWKVCFFY